MSFPLCKSHDGQNSQGCEDHDANWDWHLVIHHSPPPLFLLPLEMPFGREESDKAFECQPFLRVVGVLGGRPTAHRALLLHTREVWRRGPRGMFELQEDLATC